MKKRVLCAVVVLAVLLTWKFWPMETAKPVAPAPKSAAWPILASPKPAQIEAPKAAPVPVSDSGQTAEAISADPRVAELNVWFDEIENALNSHDYQRYLELAIEPKMLKKQQAMAGGADKFVQLSVQGPNWPEAVNHRLEWIAQFRNATPVFDGDVAKYTFVDPQSNQVSIIYFKRTDGQWYED